MMSSGDDLWDEIALPEEGDELKRLNKNLDSVESFILDENLSELQIVLHLLESGVPVQIQNAIQRFPSVFKENGAPSFQKLSAPLVTAMRTFEWEDNVALAEAYSQIVKEKYVSGADAEKWLMPMMITSLGDVKDPEIVDAWLNLLGVMIPVMDKSTLEGSVTKFALSKGEVDMSVKSRVVCCRILGALSPHLGKGAVESKFFAKAMDLCQDTDYEVRICMCRQLSAIAKAVGVELTQKSLMPELQELLNDEETAVRTAAFECLVELTDFLSPEARRTTALPIIRQYLDTSDNEATMQCTAQIFGPLIVKISGDFESDDDWNHFCQVYKNYAHSSDPRLRASAAYNFPAVLQCWGVRRYASSLHGAFMHLCNDSNEDVRRSIAAGYLEIAKLLGEERVFTYLKEGFLKLITDPCKDVQMKILADLSQILDLFKTSSESDSLHVFTDIWTALMGVQEQCGPSWRVAEAILHSLPSLAHHLASTEVVYEQMIPFMGKQLASPAPMEPVLLASASALPQIVRHLRRAAQRQEVITRIGRELARGKSCWSRLVFLLLCDHFMKHFSNRFFREHFLEYAVEMLADPVVNVRIAACALLPNLKRRIHLPEDAPLLEKLSRAANNLSTDKDRDVRAQSLNIATQFKLAPTHGDKRDPTMSPEERKRADDRDERLEQEEKDWAVKEEAELKKRREEMVNKGGAKTTPTSRRSSDGDVKSRNRNSSKMSSGQPLFTSTPAISSPHHSKLVSHSTDPIKKIVEPDKPTPAARARSFDGGIPSKPPVGRSVNPASKVGAGAKLKK